MRILLTLTCLVAVACQTTPYDSSGGEASQHRSPRSGQENTSYDEAEHADRGDRHRADRISYPSPKEQERSRDSGDTRLTSASRHPRLMVSDDDLARLQQLIQNDPVAKQWFEMLRGRADKLLDEASPPAAQQRNAKLLAVSRTCLVRVPMMAGMYRLTGEERYARRAIQEMLAACDLRDWDPSDFLATAEMTNAMSVGYDWCYAVMSPDQRARVRDAIVNNGLRPGLEAYQTHQGWTTATMNWNLVCNGGLIVGALAVQDEETRISRSVLAQARESIRYGIAGFAPDGGWEEGTTYWNYATRYLAFAMASLKTATGNVWNLTLAPGVANTGSFRMYATGPTAKPFNFGDSEENLGNASQLMWFAGAINKPVYAAFETKEAEKDPGIFDLMWYRPSDPKVIQSLPLAYRFRRVELGSMRSAWDDPEATYLCFKGGSNELKHGHLDLGTFVLDAQGQRWVTALGGDNYDLPGYFAERRYTYYRCSTRGQNTLLLDNRNQDPEGHSSILSFNPGDSKSQAVLDLSDGYKGYARRILRGFAMNRQDVLVQDDIDLTDTTDVRWCVHTTAEVQLTGQTAVLRQEGRTMMVQLLSPEKGARFEVQNVNIPSPQEPAPQGLKKLIVHLPEARGKVRIAVLFSPGEQRPSANVRLTPLSQWIAARP